MSETGLRSVTDVLLAVAAERSTGRRLHMLVDAARDQVAARYGAIGVPDGEGGFARFVTSGMSEEEIAAIGPLPRTHGLLAAMLESPAPERMPDVRRDPRYGWWPSAHPVMTSFLGVPIVAGGEIVGAFYLVNKDGGGEFSQEDEDAIALLAAHAAIAIQHAAAGERSRELSVVEERTRLARELHDSVNQTLWAAVATAEAATERLGSDPAAAEMLLHFPVQGFGLALEVKGDLQGVIKGRHLLRRELDVEDAADDLCEFSYIHSKAPIPLTISSNSEVI